MFAPGDDVYLLLDTTLVKAVITETLRHDGVLFVRIRPTAGGHAGTIITAHWADVYADITDAAETLIKINT